MSENVGRKVDLIYTQYVFLNTRNNLFWKFQFLCSICTLAKTEIIYPKNVGAQIAMDFTQDKYSAPRTIEKMKILGAVLELHTS